MGERIDGRGGITESPGPGREHFNRVRQWMDYHARINRDVDPHLLNLSEYALSCGADERRAEVEKGLRRQDAIEYATAWNQVNPRPKQSAGEDGLEDWEGPMTVGRALEILREQEGWDRKFYLEHQIEFDQIIVGLRRREFSQDEAVEKAKIILLDSGGQMAGRDIGEKKFLTNAAKDILAIADVANPYSTLAGPEGEDNIEEIKKLAIEEIKSIVAKCQSGSGALVDTNDLDRQLKGAIAAVVEKLCATLEEWPLSWERNRLPSAQMILQTKRAIGYLLGGCDPINFGQSDRSLASLIYQMLLENLHALNYASYTPLPQPDQISANGAVKTESL